jgi:prepilin-type N-terminal cleavage/methylation domain-containing protein
MKTHAPSRRPAGYTLIEVLAASAVLAIGMAASVGLTSSMMLQEELAHRVAVTRNYQENMARLWQLGMGGLGAAGVSTVAAVMPAQASCPLLDLAINGTPTLIETGTTNPGGMGQMQSASVTAAVNISQNPNPRIEQQGAIFNLVIYRPTLPQQLR